MPTYLYCLVPPASRTELASELPRGIAGSTVRVLSVGTVEAWVSTVHERPPRPSVAAVREHDAVVTAALATGRTPLPARFGQTWPSDAECMSSVALRGPDLAPLLRRVAGLVEMTVCTLVSGLPPDTRASGKTGPVAGPGTAYLEQLRLRADRERRLRTALETLRDRLSQGIGSLSRDEVAEIRGTEDALALSISYLVERDNEARFRRAVEEVAREATARLVVIGPRAPYSFAPAAQQPGPAYAVRSVDVP